MSDQIERGRYRADAIPEILEVLQEFLELPACDREGMWPEANERMIKIWEKWRVTDIVVTPSRGESIGNLGTAEPPIP